jgi:hypothetical protein
VLAPPQRAAATSSVPDVPPQQASGDNIEVGHLSVPTVAAIEFGTIWRAVGSAEIIEWVRDSVPRR